MTMAVATPTKTRSCSICNSGKRGIIDPLLAAGRSAYAIEKVMRETKTPVKSETVLKHLDGCLNGRRPSSELLTDTLVRRQHDFAAAVKDAAMEKLEAGELRITTRDGLAAQGLLDKRAEKQADRDLMVNLARLMTGRPPPEVIVGEYAVLDDDPVLELD